MHIYFSGIGGTGIGPLALIAKQAGYEVSGSDKQDSQYIAYLKDQGINNIHIGQPETGIAEVHKQNPIDWFVYSSSISIENPDHPELKFVEAKSIKHSKRDEFLSKLLEEKNQKLVAIAGTHGKSTTTAMTIWLFKELHIPVSYSVGAKLSFGDMGQFDPKSEYFVYECDEFDRNFLAFHPYISLISGIAWDHHEIYPTAESYQQAFRDFLNQSEKRVIWNDDYTGIPFVGEENSFTVLTDMDEGFSDITLKGNVNRRDAWLAVMAVHQITNEPVQKLIGIINEFPGLSRRMEQIAPNLYSDYAHTPEKIAGCMSTALELARDNNQKVVVIYEPLTNRRMNYTKDQHKDIFNGASAIYWVPTYLAREDPNQTVLSPSELVKSLNPELQKIAEAKELNDDLRENIENHLKNGDLVVAMSGGGGNSLDEWLRKEFK